MRVALERSTSAEMDRNDPVGLQSYLIVSHARDFMSVKRARESVTIHCESVTILHVKQKGSAQEDTRVYSM